MKKIILLISLAAFALASCGNAENAAATGTAHEENIPSANEPQLLYRTDSAVEDSQGKTKDASSEVWVCKSAGSRKYHANRNCGGLGRCKHKIEKMPLADAEAVGLTRCSYKKCN